MSIYIFFPALTDFDDAEIITEKLTITKKSSRRTIKSLRRINVCPKINKYGNMSDYPLKHNIAHSSRIVNPPICCVLFGLNHTPSHTTPIIPLPKTEEYIGNNCNMFLARLRVSHSLGSLFSQTVAGRIHLRRPAEHEWDAGGHTVFTNVNGTNEWIKKKRRQK